MNLADLIITVAYFSIPVQILVSLYQYPRLARMPPKIIILLVLFAFFIFFCGIGHLLRCMDRADTALYERVNGFTAAVSLATALYLLPLIPNLLGSLDDSLRDLVKMNHETEESKNKLISFMAFLCHEIRNPLFAITSSASFLGDTDLTEEQQIGVGSIFDSSLLMLRLVNDVLDLSKIDAGKLELEERDFDMHRLLENLETNMRMQVAQRHGTAVALGFDVRPDVPRIVYGDSIRFLQIVYNLLSNSSKFTSRGKIDVSVEVAGEGESLPLPARSASAEINNSDEGGPQQQAEGGGGGHHRRHSGGGDAVSHRRRNSSDGGATEGHRRGQLNRQGSGRRGQLHRQSSSRRNLVAGAGRNTGSGHHRHRSSSSSLPLLRAPHSRSSSGVAGSGNLDGEGRDALSAALLDAAERGGVTFEDGEREGAHAEAENEHEHEHEHEEEATTPHEPITLKITVTDTGIGIDPDRVETIFQPYSQAKLSDYRKHGGTGLGLSILSSLLKLMGGTIEVKSRVGHGSRFTLRLPVRAVPRDAEEAGGAAAAAAAAMEGDGTGIGGIDMSDPFLSCRRLPVYEDRDSARADDDLPRRSSCRDLSEMAGIKFFSDQTKRMRRRRLSATEAKVGPGGAAEESRTSLLEADEKKADGDRVEGEGEGETGGLVRRGSSSAVPALTNGSGKAAGAFQNQPQSPQTPPPKARARPPKRKLPTFDLPPNDHVVLVVDDNCVNRKIIGKMLHYFGVEYTEATNGQEAVDALRASRNFTNDPTAPRYGLVFMDLSMPVLDGYDAIETIRGDGLDDLPIVALTANALVQERRRALDVGADEFHTKPILRNDMHAICARFLLPAAAMGVAATGGGEESATTATAKANLGEKLLLDPPGLRSLSELQGSASSPGTAAAGTGTVGPSVAAAPASGPPPDCNDSGETASTAQSSNDGTAMGAGGAKKAMMGDVYREGISLLLRHDSVVSPGS